MSEEIGDRDKVTMRPLKWKCTNECRNLTSEEVAIVLRTKSLFQMSIVHTTSTNSRLSCHHMPPIVLYFCKSTCYSHHKVLLRSHLCKIRHSAHTHNAADPVHRYYSPENISLSIYMVPCYPRSTCSHVVHFLSSHTIQLYFM